MALLFFTYVSSRWDTTLSELRRPRLLLVPAHRGAGSVPGLHEPRT
jgi:hypothetical protein